MTVNDPNLGRDTPKDSYNSRIVGSVVVIAIILGLFLWYDRSHAPVPKPAVPAVTTVPAPAGITPAR
jgi:hypothetical protein